MSKIKYSDGSNFVEIKATDIDAMSTNQSFAGDLNTLYTSGVYRIDNLDSVQNGPQLPWGQLLVLHGHGDTIAQLYFDYQAPTIRMRSGNPVGNSEQGSWLDWQDVTVVTSPSTPTSGAIWIKP